MTTDLEEVLRAAAEKRPVDPDVAKRVHARSAEARRKLPETNVAVSLIREAREDSLGDPPNVFHLQESESLAAPPSEAHKTESQERFAGGHGRAR
jgi:hypothetical protein